MSGTLFPLLIVDHLLMACFGHSDRVTGELQLARGAVEIWWRRVFIRRRFRWRGSPASGRNQGASAPYTGVGWPKAWTLLDDTHSMKIDSHLAIWH